MINFTHMAQFHKVFNKINAIFSHHFMKELRTFNENSCEKYLYVIEQIISENVIVRLDPNTFGPLVSKLTSALEDQTDYR